MAEGGFLIKFDGKEVCRCLAVAFDYDEWQYTINEIAKKKLPEDLATISVVAERL
jgi:hypothetical protein